MSKLEELTMEVPVKIKLQDLIDHGNLDEEVVLNTIRGLERTQQSVEFTFKVIETLAFDLLEDMEAADIKQSLKEIRKKIK